MVSMGEFVRFTNFDKILVLDGLDGSGFDNTIVI